MKNLFVSSVFVAGLLGTGILRAAEDNTAALADAVWKASGGENWPQVKTIDFTFVVEKEGKPVVSAEHHWDVGAMTDRVKWKGRDVTVNLADPGTTQDAKDAYARWVNDSYWLLAPLKLKDKGCNLNAEGMKEMDGAQREVLTLSFGNVGLTPKDQYHLYIDPQTKLVTSWDYMPEPGKSMHATWTDYQKSGGLNLAMDHNMEGTRIRFVNVKVTSAK
jgi:hypothetical protein